MKYIDADKLIAEIRKLCSESCISESDEYYEYAKSEIINIIASLQQEQPVEGLEEEIEFYLDHAELATKCKGISAAEDYFNDLKAIARHFAEWGAEHLKTIAR